MIDKLRSSRDDAFRIWRETTGIPVKL